MSSLASSASVSLWRRASKQVAASTTEIIYSKPLAALRAQKVILSVSSSTNNVFHGSEIFISRRSSDLRHTVYNKLGNNINFSLNIALNGSDVEFSIQNDEAFSVDIVLFRLDVS